MLQVLVMAMSHWRKRFPRAKMYILFKSSHTRITASLVKEKVPREYVICALDAWLFAPLITSTAKYGNELEIAHMQ